MALLEKALHSSHATHIALVYLVTPIPMTQGAITEPYQLGQQKTMESYQKEA